ncbi:MAG TPA: hypothetical protein VGO47_01460 [Chlamydiales bacterium]|jgi:hypothetical protein|nr:hypothetical protein [Chlamydiales bacterium]
MTLKQTIAAASLIDDRDVFFKVLKDSIGNIVWYGCGALVVALVGKIVWIAGVVLFGVFGLILAVSAVHSLISVVLSIVMIPVTIYEKVRGGSLRLREQLYLNAASLIQLTELAILSAYAIGLYRIFF